MINEPLMQELRAITDYLDSIDPQWRKKIAPTATGAAGSMTPAPESHLEGWIVPRDAPVNIRREMRVDIATFAYKLPSGESRRVIDAQTVGDYVWFKLEDGNYARADVVTFSKEQPITPIRAALWPAPVTGYDITNTHNNARDHDGYDYSCAYGTPIQAGPNGGFVAKAFTCQFCNVKEGDGKSSLQDPGKAFGYGSHIIVRYAYDSLPQAVKTAIPNGAYVFAIYAHLSKVLVSQGQTLEPYQIIGEVGASGNTYGINGGDPSHLHFSLRWSTHPEASWAGMSNNRIDPKLLTKA
jgi:hypothetical protein